MTQSPTLAAPFVEEIDLEGHIIDSLLLPKVLDEIPDPRRHLSAQAHGHWQAAQ